MIGAILAAALALNPAVRQDNLRETICRPGYVASIRPAVSYTNRVKRKLLRSGAKASDFELDHHLPISLGGHPSDPRNLKLQPWPAARKKDVLETQLSRAVCAGRVTLHDAQLRIWAWQP